MRTESHKFIGCYNDPLDQPGVYGLTNSTEWELFDLVSDPFEVNYIYGEPGHEAITAARLAELERLQLTLATRCTRAGRLDARTDRRARPC